MATATVLIVDDEVDFSRVIAERLTSRGYTVETAENGKTALEIIKTKNFDAILLDLAMPEMDGIETMEKMLVFDKNLQIIILTGYGSVQKGVDAVKRGAVDFLEKPADVDTLTGMVDEAQKKRVMLFDSDLEKKMSDIMRKKGW